MRLSSQRAGATAARRGVRRAQAAVVGLGDGDDVFDVGLTTAGEGAPGIEAVDASAEGRDDARLDRLGIGIVVPVVWRATVFGGYRQPAPGFGGECRTWKAAATSRTAASGRRSGDGFIGDSVTAFACVSDDLSGRGSMRPALVDSGEHGLPGGFRPCGAVEAEAMAGLVVQTFVRRRCRHAGREVEFMSRASHISMARVSSH